MANTRSKSALRYRSDSRHYRILEEISAGDLFVGFLSSSMSTSLMHRVARKRAQDRYKNKIALGELETRGFIRQLNKHGDTTFIITENGKSALHNAYMQTSQKIKRPEYWDGAWRVISYDFPESKRSQRNSLRYILEKAGFLMIQKSVWIFPYDSPLLSSLLKENTTITACTVFMRSVNMTSEEKYKKHFKL